MIGSFVEHATRMTHSKNETEPLLIILQSVSCLEHHGGIPVLRQLKWQHLGNLISARIHIKDDLLVLGKSSYAEQKHKDT